VDEKTVLIIDGDAASRKFLTHTLQEQGYAVIQAGSGREGLVFAWRDRPDVIVLDPSLPDLGGDVLIKKLRQDQRTASTPVIALSGIDDTERMNVSLEQGFNEYIVKSGEAIARLLEAIPRLLGIKTEAPRKTGGLQIVFLSAKGGTGTSSLCANVAMNIARTEPESNTVVADMVLPIGSIAPLVGYKGSINLATIADVPSQEMTPAFLRESLPNIGLWRFQLLAGSPDPETANLLQVKRIPHVIEALQAAFDYVLIDLGRSLSRISLPIIQQADMIALIVSTDLGTVTLTKTVLEYLQAQGVDTKKIYPILNRAVGLEGMLKSDAEKILGLDIVTTVPYMGSNFIMANNQNQPIAHKFPHDTATVVLQQMTTTIIDRARNLRS